MRTAVVESGQRAPIGAFGGGLLAGFLAAVMLVAGAGKAVQQRGISVRMQTAPIAAQVQTEVRAAVRREVPATLATMKDELPKRIAAETVQRMSGISVGVAGFNVPIPEAATRQVQSGVESAVRAGLNVAVQDDDINALSDRLAAQAANVVQANLNTYLAGRTFPVDLWPGFSVPVTVVPE